MKAINEFEELLQVHNNTVILKFYLHISQEEQAQRLQERLDNPKNIGSIILKMPRKRSFGTITGRCMKNVFEKCDRPPWIIVLQIKIGIKSS